MSTLCKSGLRSWKDAKTTANRSWEIWCLWDAQTDHAIQPFDTGTTRLSDLTGIGASEVVHKDHPARSWPLDFPPRSKVLMTESHLLSGIKCMTEILTGEQINLSIRVTDNQFVMIKSCDDRPVPTPIGTFNTEISFVKPSDRNRYTLRNLLLNQCKGSGGEELAIHPE